MINLRLSDRGILLVSLMLLLQLLYVAVLAVLLNYANHQVERERALLKLTVQVNRTSALLDSASTGLLVQIHTPDLPSSKAFYDTYYKFIAALPDQLSILQQLGSGTPYLGQIENLAKIEEEASSQMESCRHAYLNTTPARNYMILECKRLSDMRTSIVDDLLSEVQKAQQSEMHRESQTRFWLAVLLGAGLVLDVGMALFLMITFTREITARIEQLRENAIRLATGMPLNQAIKKHDELGELDSVFHQMAASLAEVIGREQAMIKNAVDLICMIDADGTFLDVNPACKTILGMAQDELLGRRCVDIVQPDFRSKTFDMIQEAIKKKEPAQFENRLLTKDGGTIDASWAVHWSSDEKALFCVVHDITQRKQVDRLKQEFVAMVSHDLKAPLTSIRLVLDTLTTGTYGELSDTGTVRVSSATAAADRLIALVNGLLSIEKLESGQSELDSRLVKASAIIEPSVQSVHSLAQVKSIDLIVTDNDDPTCYGDRDRLIQVLVNLLSNAIKFSPANETIKIKVFADLNAVKFEVSDRGRGVPEAMREKIFDRFSQLKRVDETEKGGTGIGLSICRAIVQKHGGAIGVYATQGQGSTFWFSIPDSADK